MGLAEDETLSATGTQAFVAGAQIAGRYRVVRAIGNGGMGEVFEAEDLVVGSRVALKVLRADRSEPKMIERLRRELALARKVTHRNVCRIHDLGDHEGRVFLTMELLDGETLSKRIQRGPVSDARAIAAQLCAGLGAAHAAGVIHRDFKSSNVVLVGERAVVTDFGLARAEAPGEQVDLTGDAAMLGTAAYMAPEQVEGKPATPASDVYALGVVLFEMVTGSVPFRADTPLATASLRLTTSPPLERLPAEWRAAIGRCLAREPRDRFASTDDVAAAIERVRPRTRPPWLALAAIAMLPVIVVGALLVEKPAPKAAAQPTFTPITFRRGTVINARFAPDGRIVYSAAWDGEEPATYAAQSGTPDVRMLWAPGTSLLSIANDGKVALLQSSRVHGNFNVGRGGTLAIAELAGGEPRPLVENVRAADWSTGDKPIVVHNAPAFVELPTGKRIDDPDIANLRVSRDGRHIAMHRIEAPVHSIVIADGNGTKRELFTGTEAIAGLAWHGSEVWFAIGNALHAVDMRGRARVILQSPGQLYLHDISADGRVLLARDKVTREAALRNPGAADRSLSWFDDTFPFSLSANGEVMLFAELGEAFRNTAGRGGVFVRRIEGSPPVKIFETSGVGPLSPDGTQAVLWEKTKPGETERLVLVPTSTGEPRRIPNGLIRVYYAMHFMPDGKHIVFDAVESGAPTRIYLQQLPDGQPRRISPDDTDFFSGPHDPSSLDGKRLFVNQRGKRAIMSIADGSFTDIAGLTPVDVLLRWSPTDKLYVAKTSATTATLVLLDPITGTREELFTVSPSDPAGVEIPPRLVLTADAKTVVYSFRRRLSQLFVVDGLR